MTHWSQPNQVDLENPVPWLYPEATAYLESLLRPDMTVLEHGSGGSTLWFAARVKRVLAIENDPDWTAAVSKLLPQNAKIASDIGLSKLDHWADLVLIDGEPMEDRCLWMRLAPRIVKAGGYIVVDNVTQRVLANDRAWLREQATLLRTIDAGPPLAHGVTDFYQVGE